MLEEAVASKSGSYAAERAAVHAGIGRRCVGRRRLTETLWRRPFVVVRRPL